MLGFNVPAMFQEENNPKVGGVISNRWTGAHDSHINASASLRILSGHTYITPATDSSVCTKRRSISRGAPVWVQCNYAALITSKSPGGLSDVPENETTIFA